MNDRRDGGEQQLGRKLPQSLVGFDVSNPTVLHENFKSRQKTYSLDLNTSTSRPVVMRKWQW
jgi:hypothetical protein